MGQMTAVNRASATVEGESRLAALSLVVEACGRSDGRPTQQPAAATPRAYSPAPFPSTLNTATRLPLASAFALALEDFARWSSSPLRWDRGT